MASRAVGAPVTAACAKVLAGRVITSRRCMPPAINLDQTTLATTNPPKTDSRNGGPLQAIIALGLAVFATLLAAPEGRAQAPNSTPPPAAAPPPSAKALHDWRRGMARVPAPRQGCFTSSYPSTEWHEVPCTTAPQRPYPPARGPRPDTVGNGTDVSAQVGGHISEAIGSFDSVTGVTTVTDPAGVSNFSLQLNSSFFPTSTCNGEGIPGRCRGWQQFVYSNSGIAFIQYWLLNFNTTCPTGWNTFNFSCGNDCWRTGSNAVLVPFQAVANLINLSLTGQANDLQRADGIAIGQDCLSAVRSHYVQPYLRSNGTYVQGHYQTNPNHTPP